MINDNLLYSTIEEKLEECRTDGDYAEWARDYAQIIIMTYKEVDKVNFDYYCQLKGIEADAKKNKILIEALKAILPDKSGVKVKVDEDAVIVINKGASIEAIEDKEEYKLEFNKLFKLSPEATGSKSEINGI
jgi:hypothetical protein